MALSDVPPTLVRDLLILESFYRKWVFLNFWTSVVKSCNSYFFFLQQFKSIIFIRFWEKKYGRRPGTKFYQMNSFRKREILKLIETSSFVKELQIVSLNETCSVNGRGSRGVCSGCKHTKAIWWFKLSFTVLIPLLAYNYANPSSVRTLVSSTFSILHSESLIDFSTENLLVLNLLQKGEKEGWEGSLLYSFASF